MVTTLLDRFNAGHIPEPNSGCWLWIRAWNSMGYGKICGFGDGSSRLAHRWAYEHFRGPIPAGMVLDHLCRTPACVNPDHLEVVTQTENIARGLIPAIFAAANANSYQRRKTHCPKGHPLSGKNCYVTAQGRRHCRACDRIGHAERRNAMKRAASSGAPFESTEH